MTDNTLFAMKNRICSDLCTVMATILSLSESEQILRSFGNLGGQDIQAYGWLGSSSQCLSTSSANTSLKNRLYSADDVSPIKRRYVAVKVLIVNATCAVIDRLLPEDDSFYFIAHTNPNNAGYGNCLTLHGASERVWFVRAPALPVGW
jgi:hypothetical protein